MKDQKKYYLIDRDNNYCEYDSFEHLISCIGIKGIGNNFNDTYTTTGWFLEYIKHPVDYVVLDSMNRVVQTYILEEAIKEYSEKNPKKEYVWVPRSISCKNYPGFRYGPVPFTGKVHGYGRYYRHPKTRQERIANLYDDKFVRGKRKDKHLPTSWWDISRKDTYDRNWKRFRKTQYK